MATTTLTSTVRLDALKTILLAGFAGGLGDILYAITVWGFRGVPPARILQGIAGGLLGSEAFAGGMATVLLGTALHFSIATCAAAFYYFLSSRFRLLVDRPVPCGILFGLGMYGVMNYIVVPLSASPLGLPKWGGMMIGGLFAHTILFGLPIALLTRRGLNAAAGR